MKTVNDVRDISEINDGDTISEEVWDKVVCQAVGVQSYISDRRQDVSKASFKIALVKGQYTGSYYPTINVSVKNSSTTIKYYTQKSLEFENLRKQGKV